MYFYSPEECTGNDEEFDAYPLDVWALGVTVYCLTYLKLPFTNPNNSIVDLFNKIEKSEVVFPDGERKVSDGLKDIIARMLIKDPRKRITVKELKSHFWINQNRPAISEKKQKLIEITNSEIKMAMKLMLPTEVLWILGDVFKKNSNSVITKSDEYDEREKYSENHQRSDDDDFFK